MYIINLKKTWEKLLLAARAIVAIENPADVCVISSRNTGQVRPPLLAHLTYTRVQIFSWVMFRRYKMEVNGLKRRGTIYTCQIRNIFIYWCALVNITLVSSVGLV